MTDWNKILELELRLTRPVIREWTDEEGNKQRRVLPKPAKTKEEYDSDMDILDEMLALTKPH